MLRDSRDILIVMTRLPRVGRNKTRLIPALGPAGATAMHDRLARHTVGRVSAFVLMHPASALRICLDGGCPSDGRAWLGDCDCRIQVDGDLGQRLAAAVEDAFDAGARRVVVIGTDCPSLDEPLLADAFAALVSSDLVFGPAADGGYYLIGLARSCPPVFRGMDWGGPEVLHQSLEAARTAGHQAALLDVRPDVDTPEDLPSAEVSLALGNTLSVIIPTLNNESHLPRLLERLQQDRPHEIIVADGGRGDVTLAMALQAGVKTISTPRGWRSQMNLAAAMAGGEFLLFLHADILPPAGYPETIRMILQQPGTSAGVFRSELDGGLSVAALTESLVDLRRELRSTPFGEQGLFIRRRLFRYIGGFPD